jgi:hypothetical protein
MRRLDISDWEKVGEQRGTRPGGVYENPETGEWWYVKTPTSRRQLRNELVAGALYTKMGFTTPNLRPTREWRLAAQWIDNLPDSASPAELARRDGATDAFLPSALIANWDVVGLEYDNMLPDPDDANGVVLLDFGGSFDTRAMGGPKPYAPDEIPALEGFLDRGINPTAPRIFGDMSVREFERSKDRLRSLALSDAKQAIGQVHGDDAAAQERHDTLTSRYDRLVNISYEEVFG